jgi:PAB-dependent poly(A)-specific ribonuclease subunit 2
MKLQLPTEWSYTIMRKTRYVCAATDNGSVNVLDPSNFQILKTWKAHGTAINDMDAHNDFLVTCGYSVRHGGQPIVDPLANVYDLKSLKPIAPIPFHAGAAFVRMLPNMQTTAVVASQTGQLQLVDLMNPNTVNLRQANIANYMLMLDLAPSGQALAVADSEGNIHLWGSPSKIRFSLKSREIEFPAPPARSSFIDWNSTPLNLIGMPYYHDKLLSAWPSNMVFEVGAPPAPVDPSILPHLRPFEIGQYAPNPRKKRRYQVEKTRVAPPSESALAAPKFLSEKAREPMVQVGRRASDAAEALAGTSLDAKNEEDLLLKYSNVEIKYSKFGVEDFDFKFYNKTAFSGLETHIANSFTNSLLQLFKFIPLVRNLALHHAATGCIFEQCLLCEMGFLFDMLDKAKGQNCQATNLLKCFSSYREAANLGLLEENLANKSLSVTIQAVTRFFLSQMSHDFRQTSPAAPEADQILAIGAAEAIRCMYCRTETVKPGEVFIHELIYPPHDHKNRNPKFSQLLKASIERETHSRGWCNKCRRYQQLALRKTIHRMPLVMMINAALNNPAYRHLWANKGWLPEEIGILVDGGHVFCFEGEDLRFRMRNNPDLILYDLVGFVSEIDIHEHQKPHLVSFINGKDLIFYCK